MKRALVTGGNRGIGLAIAKRLVAQGHKVFIGCSDIDAGQSVADQIGAEAWYIDLADDPYIPPYAAEVDILVNNAGVLFEAPLFWRKADFFQTMSVMLNGPYELIRKCHGYMNTQDWGRIVSLSSRWGRNRAVVGELTGGRPTGGFF